MSQATSPHVMVCVTEDWFALSHFRPLLALLGDLGHRITVVTNNTGRRKELEAYGARVIDVDFRRASLNPLGEIACVARLAGIFHRERPNIVHLIAMKPIVQGALALRLTPGTKTIIHMTGLGFLTIADTLKVRAARRAALAAVSVLARRRTTWLLAENDDDLAFLRDHRVDAGPRTAILGGAGVDPDAFPAMPPPANTPPVAAFVGRMIRSKGVATLIDAHRQVADSGVDLSLRLFGQSDAGNPGALTVDDLASLNDAPDVTWDGPTTDVAGVWRNADIAVSPAISREGLPRAMLEAAACARPLIVSDVPGCRHFVTDGVEGFIVPPGDPLALAKALQTLAQDPALRLRMGTAARARLLNGFTEADVKAALRSVYRALQ